MRVGALACKGCGSDVETGWHAEASERGVDLPTGYAGEEEFDYDAFTTREFGQGGRHGARPWRRILAFALVILLALLIAL